MIIFWIQGVQKISSECEKERKKRVVWVLHNYFVALDVESRKQKNKKNRLEQRKKKKEKKLTPMR